jgi:hypothetical protein
MRTKDSYREISLDALPLRQVPNGVPPVAPADQPPLRRWRPEPESADHGRAIISAPPAAAIATNTAAAAPQPAPDPNPEPDPPEPPAEPAVAFPAPQFLPPASAPSHRWIWVLAIGVGLGVGAAGFQTRQAWLPKVVAAVNPAPPARLPPPALGLNAADHEGQLQINWDRNSRALLEAQDAMLEITDGTATQAIQLDSAHLRAGSFTYARQGEKVDVKLIVHQTNAPDVREVTSFLGKLPESKPPVEDPEIQKQRDALAKQAAKLKLDLNWQALKTKKLERDLQSMREEMRQQQIKRMTNQLPDK